MSVKRDLLGMESREYDVVIIGGGINGTAAARDAALRGLRVALVEKNDFGWGTTARSTRLIHGGLRYLELFDFKLVRESLREREVLLRGAPHLVKPLPFITPIYRHTRRGPFSIRVGMLLYDVLSYDKSLPSYSWLRTDEVAAKERDIETEGLLGGALYYDAQASLPERFCIEHLQEACANGADAANYAEVVGIEKAVGEPGEQREGYRLSVRDRLTGRTHTLFAPVVLNAAGPWADAIPESPVQGRLRKTKGIHILVPPFLRHAIVLVSESDGRVFFAIPWEGATLIGTTDTDYDGDPGEAKATPEDVAYLIRETKRLFPRADLETIFLSMAGIRPLVRQGGAKSESAVSRKHLIVDSNPAERCGIVSILGGKITNHRVVAEEAVDAACKKLKVRKASSTDHRPLYGGDMGEDPAKTIARWEAEYERLPLPKGTIRRLADIYGSRTPEVLVLCEKDQTLCRPLADGRPEIEAQIVYSVEREMCIGSADFLLRRSGLGLLPGGLDAGERVRQRLKARLGWDKEREEKDRERLDAEAALLWVPGTPGVA